VRSPWSRRQKIAFGELVNESWQLSALNSLQLAEAFRAIGLLAPRSLLQFADARSSLKVLSVKLPIEPRPVTIITLKDRTLSPVASLFIACAREVVKPLAKLR
jgi:DNA-binding transcriptional LysR family regulator